MGKKLKSNRRKASLLAISMVAILTFFGLKINTNQYFMVTRVVDGDNFEIDDGRRIRLINIDTPEEDQCFRDQSTQISTSLLLNQQVKIETDTNEMDRFGRTLAYVFLKDGTFLNKKLLEEGVGEFQIDTVNLKYQDILVSAAVVGHDQIKGLWSACAPDYEKGCLVKGNVDKRGQRRYVLPESRYYKNTVIRFDKEDRWFCTEELAKEAGFIKARL